MKSFPATSFLVVMTVLLMDCFVWAGPRGRAGVPPARRPHDGLPPGSTDQAAGRIDAYMQSYWMRTGVSPLSVIDDATFLRRASLALNGISPTPNEARAFLDNDLPEKRALKVDELLTRSRYADYWGFRFREWITQLREVKGQSTNRVSLYYYCRQAMAENRSWARIARDLLATDGDVSQHGWANFALYFDTEPNEVAEAASRMFLGTNLSCAQCHDDPYVDQWKQKTYWGMAAFFARAKIQGPSDSYYDRFPLEARPPTSVSTLPGGDAAVDGEWGDVRAYVEVDQGEAKLPGTDGQEVIMPMPLGGATIADADMLQETRRAQLVSWIVDEDNPFFARAAVNRMWLALTGLGFVDSFDGFSPLVPVRHEELLDLLAQEFSAHNHDFKWLMRTIVLSQLFQLEHSNDLQVSETWHAIPPRLLNGDQWLDSIVRATGEEERIYTLAAEIAPLLEQEHADRLAGVVPWDPRSEQTEKSTIPPPPKDSVEQNTVQIRLEQLREEYATIGRRVAHLRARARAPMSPLTEALMSMNGEIATTSLQHGTTATRIAKLPTHKERAEAGFLTVLGRLPVNREFQILPDTVASDPAAAVSDLLWTLLQTTEFRTY